MSGSDPSDDDPLSGLFEKAGESIDTVRGLEPGGEQKANAKAGTADGEGTDAMTDDKNDEPDPVEQFREKLGAAEKAQWVPYEGPQGGSGWKNLDTGEIDYSENPPGEQLDESDIGKDADLGKGAEEDPEKAIGEASQVVKALGGDEAADEFAAEVNRLTGETEDPQAIKEAVADDPGLLNEAASYVLDAGGGQGDSGDAIPQEERDRIDELPEDFTETESMEEMDEGDGGDYDPDQATDDIYDEFEDATESEIGDAMIEISEELPDDFKRDWARPAATDMGYADVDQFVEDIGGIDAAFEEATNMGPGRGEFLLEHVTEDAARSADDPESLVGSFREALGGDGDGGGGDGDGDGGDGSVPDSWDELRSQYSDEEMLNAMDEPVKREQAEEYLMAGAGQLGDQWLRDMASSEGIEVSNTESPMSVAGRMSEELDHEELNKYMYDAVGPYGIDQEHPDPSQLFDPEKLPDEGSKSETPSEKARGFVESQRGGADGGEDGEAGDAVRSFREKLGLDGDAPDDAVSRFREKLGLDDEGDEE